MAIGRDINITINCTTSPAKHKTHYDEIRSMSIEELAKLIAENIDCCVCRSIHHAEDDCCPTAFFSKACPDLWLEWLQQEVDA